MLEKETEVNVNVKNEENLHIDNTDKEIDVVLDATEEIVNTTEKNVEEILVEEIVEEIQEDKQDTKESTFIKEILVGAIDQMVSMVAALAILLVFNLILKIFGYYVAEKEPMFLIMYVLVNVIYSPVCKKFKFKSTVGQKLLLNK